jgi:transcriptional regulator with PAS, ATPase and Fis domain
VSHRGDDVPTDIVGDRSHPTAPRLVATWNGGSLVRDLPPSGTLTIGRGEGAEILIDDNSVSRSHAQLVCGDRMTLEDLGSSNGTWVDGKKLEPHTPEVVWYSSLLEIGSVLVVVRGPAEPAQRGSLAADPEMARVYENVDLVARSKLSVLLLGETGVGKELLAARIHAGSTRAARPLVKLNCAALVETLLEAELFGYEKGSFTGATSAKEGLLEAADGGTLFLDEVGEMPLTTQAKLLRVLESGQLTRIGGIKPRNIDVRFVAATNRDLKKLVKSGRFREDLFFRLDGFSIAIPPLRRRTSEVGELAVAFVREACAESDKPLLAISDEALQKLLAHRWPGNVRELKNVMARSVLFCKGRAIQPDDIRFEAGAGVRTSERMRSVEAHTSERERIIAALAEAAGNQTRAAKLLGISRRTLLNRLDELDLPRPRKGENEGED